jgi:hypothetical protein
MQAEITFKIDTDSIQSCTDQYVAGLWHIAQANPADQYASPVPGLLAEAIGREIIRRFLAMTSPELWRHQGCHFDWGQRHLDGDRRAGERWSQIEDELRQRKLLDKVDEDVMANLRAAAVKIIREDDSKFVQS